MLRSAKDWRRAPTVLFSGHRRPVSDQVNTSLTTLWLGDNLLEEKGARALAEALRGSSSLKTLDLGCNSIGAFARVQSKKLKK